MFGNAVPRLLCFAAAAIAAVSLLAQVRHSVVVVVVYAFPSPVSRVVRRRGRVTLTDQHLVASHVSWLHRSSRSSQSLISRSSRQTEEEESENDQPPPQRRRKQQSLPIPGGTGSERYYNTWESLARIFIDIEQEPENLKDFVQLVSVFRVGLPALFIAFLAKSAYPPLCIYLAQSIINDSGVFAVVSQDASQYIQNILTTSGLVFSLLVGQTYYFMYQQQEAIYLALFEEVTIAKSLLEQVALVCQGRESLYRRILDCIEIYVKDDLTKFNDDEPAELISARPVDDPLEDILYLTSVGEPSVVYQTVRSLRQARAHRLGALQRKLPALHMILLWVLAFNVIFTFPLLGAGSQTIGGIGILYVQAWYLSFIVFGIGLVMGVVYELQRPGESGAYNAGRVLAIMVAGLEEELEQRLQGEIGLLLTTPGYYEPSVDSDGYLEDP